MYIFACKAMLEFIDLQKFNTSYIADKPIKFKKGISGKGKNIITKHDPELDSKKNAKKIMEVRETISFLVSFRYEKLLY